MTTVDFNEIDWAPAANDALFNAAPGDAENGLLAVNPRDVRRAETAPMVLTILGADGTLCVGGLEDDVAPGEEYRYTQEYHELYYSKMPRDPRMLPPLTRRGRTTHADATQQQSGTIGEKLRTTAPYTAVSTGKVHAGSHNNNNANTAASNASGEFVAAVSQGSRGASSRGSPSNQPLSQHQQQQQQQYRGGVATTTTVAPKVYASKLREYIETFRPDWDYSQIRGHVFEFSADQDGSRLVQRLIEKPENMPEMFEEVYDKFEQMAVDVFGNYVLQKLFESVPKAVRAATASAEGGPTLAPEVAQAVLSADMMPRLVAKVRGHLREYSMNTYGCRVMQKALDNMDPSDCEEIIHEVEGCVTQCVFDQNANHVIQRMIEVCPDRCQFVIDAFQPQLRELSSDAYGCRVLQRSFEMCHNVPEVNIRPLLEQVLSCINEFTLHQFGNYVVQHAMLNAPEDLRVRFVSALSPSLYALSCSKFASNVAEKVICVANESERDSIIQSLTKPLGESQGGNYLVMMMQDTYANYVVQRLLESVSPTQRQRIGELVSPHVELINASVYGRHLLRKMEAMEVISAEFLRMKGIDVTTSDYNGAGNNNGRGGNNGNGRRGGNNNGANRSMNNVGGRHSNNNGRGNNRNSNNNNRTNDNNNNSNAVSSNNNNPQMMAMPGMVYSNQFQQQPGYSYMGYMPMPNAAAPVNPSLPQQQPQAPQQQQQPFSAMFPTGFPTPTANGFNGGNAGTYMTTTSASLSPNQMSLSYSMGNNNKGNINNNNTSKNGSRQFSNNNNNNGGGGGSNSRPSNNNNARNNINNNNTNSNNTVSPHQSFYVNGGYVPPQQQQQQQQPMMGTYFAQQPQMYMQPMMPQLMNNNSMGSHNNNNKTRFGDNSNSGNANGTISNNGNRGGSNSNNMRKQGTTYVAPKRNGAEGRNQPYVATGNMSNHNNNNGNFEAAAY